MSRPFSSSGALPTFAACALLFSFMAYQLILRGHAAWAGLFMLFAAISIVGMIRST